MNYLSNADISKGCEHFVVKNYLLSGFKVSTIANRLAFRPTGSTMAALVCITYHLIRLLESKEYIKCLFIYFNKPFDTVSHII